MEWSEYIKQIIESEKCLDNISVEIDGVTESIPQIIKASVFMLEKMIKNQGKYNLFVFPDGDQLPFLFMLSKLIYNIYLGKIEKKYNPEDFVHGQMLKLGNAVVEFDRIESERAFNGEKAIYVKTSGCTDVMKLEFAPYFQKTKKIKKSSEKKYYEEKSKIKRLLSLQNSYLSKLSDMKTYMTDSLFYVAFITKSKDQAKTIKINNESMFDYFLVGQTDYSGKIELIKDKESGTPSLVFSSQIAYVNEAIRRGEKCQSVIINLAECDVESQLVELDELKTYKVPIVCVTDTINSFDLDVLKDRGFNIWRWDADSITSNLCESKATKFGKRIDSCMGEKIVYEDVKFEQIDTIFSLLNKYRSKLENESMGINAIYTKLFSYAFFLLRNIREINKAERNRYDQDLSSCEKILEKEKPFITENTYEDYKEIIDLLKTINTDAFVFPKRNKILELLLECEGKKICVICGNNENSGDIRKSILGVLPENAYNYKLHVYTIRDYLKNRRTDFDIVIIVGWFRAEYIRKIIYGYEVNKVYLLNYGIEKRWCCAHTKSWKQKLNNSNNKTIVQNSFSKDKKNTDIIIKTETKEELTKTENGIITEQDDLEYVLLENKYRQYCSNGNKDGEEITEAKPVSYVGGSFSLFRKGHKIIVCTKMIQQITNRIDVKEVEELSIGDFVVIREASKDLIKEVADKILESNNKIHLRAISEIWQEALKIESSFNSIDDIAKRLKEEGCDRNIQTIRNWIYNDEIIIPKRKEDLIAIAHVTQDSVLLEKLDEIYDAGETIKRAHIKAGRILSDRLTDSIGQIIQEKHITDPYNIWDPIELEIEGVGPTKILKIMDIGQEWLFVNYSDTNKILSEEKGDELWQG
ncbi:MAG: DrmE family protein [Lachnospiraceae bacterium]|nr:DrmE family protein [Lachnospiraceae bacterium]